MKKINKYDHIINEVFPVNLAIARDKANLTLTKLGELAGIDRRKIADYELGKSKPRIDNFIILCKVLKVSPNELLDWSDDDE